MTDFIIVGDGADFTVVQEIFDRSFEKARSALQLLHALRHNIRNDEARVQVTNEFMLMLSDPQQIGIEKLLVGIRSGSDEGWQNAVKWARATF